MVLVIDDDDEVVAVHQTFCIICEQEVETYFDSDDDTDANDDDEDEVLDETDVMCQTQIADEIDEYE